MKPKIKRYYDVIQEKEKVDHETRGSIKGTKSRHVSRFENIEEAEELYESVKDIGHPVTIDENVFIQSNLQMGTYTDLDWIETNIIKENY